MLSAALTLFALCACLAACGADQKGQADQKEEMKTEEKAGEKEEPKTQTKAEDDVWRGIAPGMEDLSDITERTEYMDVAVESEVLFDNDLKEMVPVNEMQGRPRTEDGTTWLPVGTRFVQGEPVQFWAEVGERADIWLCGKDNSRELLVKDFSLEYVDSMHPYQWYMDRDGNCYCYGEVYTADEYNVYSRSQSKLVKVLPSGEILYSTATEPQTFIAGLCQTQDGRMYVLLDDRNEDRMFGKWKVAEVDPDTGELRKESLRELASWRYGIYLGTAGSFPAVTGYGSESSRMIAKMDMADGSLLPVLYFIGISYGWHGDMELRDFQVAEDGAVALLWSEPNGTGGLLETLRMEKVERIPIVVRGSFYDTWFGNKVVRFNSENDKYHVVVEDCGLENDRDDFARLTSIQIGSGKGPDIIQSGLMYDYMEGMQEKGVLEELNPYMEASGISEEDYFPLAFSVLRQGEKIYGVSPRWSIWEYAISQEVLESSQAPDIETLADALLAWEGGGYYHEAYDSAQVLRYFFEGTDSLWGMLDWESGSCDFDTPLFYKLLEAAKRYGDDGRSNLEPITVDRLLYNVGYFKTEAELAQEGKVGLGVLSDEGCYPACSNGNALSVNANSTKKEGAWEFIRFLISEEAQFGDRGSSAFEYPVHRKAYESCIEKFIEQETYIKRVNGVDVPVYWGTEITEERLTEFREKIETARPQPIRTSPVIDIIIEEAADYFKTGKRAEDVAAVINRRVQLYLNERK